MRFARVARADEIEEHASARVLGHIERVRGMTMLHEQTDRTLVRCEPWIGHPHAQIAHGEPPAPRLEERDFPAVRIERASAARGLERRRARVERLRLGVRVAQRVGKMHRLAGPAERARWVALGHGNARQESACGHLFAAEVGCIREHARRVERAVRAVGVAERELQRAEIVERLHATVGQKAVAIELERALEVMPCGARIAAAPIQISKIVVQVNFASHEPDAFGFAQ